MAQVQETKSDGVVEDKVVPNLMTRVRLEHELESLRRDRQSAEHAISQLSVEAKRKEQPVHEALRAEMQSTARGIGDKIEAKIKQLTDLNEGINTEEPQPEKKIGQ